MPNYSTSDAIGVNSGIAAVFLRAASIPANFGCGPIFTIAAGQGMSCERRKLIRSRQLAQQIALEPRLRLRRQWRFRLSILGDPMSREASHARRKRHPVDRRLGKEVGPDLEPSAA